AEAGAELGRATVVSLLERAEDEWARVAECCAVIPAALVPMDLTEANVRIQPAPNDRAPFVFDWADSGIGSPVIDLDGRVLDLDAYAARRRRLDDGLDLPSTELLTKAAAILAALHKGAHLSDIAPEEWPN